MNEAAADGSATVSGSIENRELWKMAWLTLAILSISFGSPLLVVVGLKPMQEALGTERSVLALAGALVWIGTGAGGVLMGWLADRIGVRATVALGAVMMAGGLALSSLGPIWALYVGQGLMVGLLGNGGIYAPLLVHVSRWFDRRRGTAIALISSGQYVAGVVWPALFERGIAELGWQPVMRAYAVVVLLAILPATLLIRPAPTAAPAAAWTRGGRVRPPHRRPASQRRAGAALPRGLLLLHPHGDPLGASRGLLQRHRHQPDPQRPHAVGDAGGGLPRPPGVGRAGRPHRRAAHGDDGLGLPGGGHQRASC